MALETFEKIYIESCDDFSPQGIFECGQAFRWNADENGSYTGIAFGTVAKVHNENGRICIESSDGSYEKVWHAYFDMERDYGELRREISREKKLSAACEFGKGIRILNQEPWEALCSFIISQCNNIPRIKGIVEKLCMLCGDEIEFMGKTYHAFPAAESIAALSMKELDLLRSGYRAAYISEAAKGVADGSINLKAIKSLPTDAAKKELLKIPGVGEKVASCTLLFGLGKLDAFPVDVWMKRAISEFFGEEKFDYRRFGKYAGLAQQYMFHYMRNGR
ncbi:MAG: DNA-3-methyladenine glycosylase 2 family protein [Oscillospiraceae bacterium]|nr:DNA-3-methyladenine glycosylase 2 family protein [Oscillospiraceae bacterium]